MLYINENVIISHLITRKDNSNINKSELFKCMIISSACA